MATLADSFVAPAAEIAAAFGALDADELVFVLQQCLEAGAWDHALALTDALERVEQTPGIRLCRAVATFLSGDTAGGLSAVDGVLAGGARPLPALSVRAEMLLRLGQREAARESLLELVGRYPDYPRAQGLLATLYMPGPHYREVLARLHQLLRPKTYLEIGVDTGATLALAGQSELAVGVDPVNALRVRLASNARFFEEASDEFFSKRGREAVFGARRVALAFIDGLHRFENALSDFANVESWSDPAGTIVLHDCVPILARAAARERSTKFWVGDTWKIVPALRAYRPELKITTVLAPPSGLVVVRRLNPGSRVLSERRNEILQRFLPLSFERAPGDFAPELNPVQNDESGLAQALGG
jgi:Methyltransferase domain